MAEMGELKRVRGCWNSFAAAVTLLGTSSCDALGNIYMLDSTDGLLGICKILQGRIADGNTAL